MELHVQYFFTMLAVFVVTITAVLTEFNSGKHTTTRQPKHVFKPRNGRRTNPTRNMNAGNVNTTQKPNLAERGIWIVPLPPKGIDSESGINTKKTTAATKSLTGTNMGKYEFSTTDNSMKDTKTEQENLSYSAVTMIYSADPTNSSLATNNLTALTHDRANSENIGTMVGLAVSALVLVVAVVVGLLCWLCYNKRVLCFKRKAERSPVPVYKYTIKYNNIQPTDGREYNKMMKII